jgi:hypothetical protein
LLPVSLATPTAPPLTKINNVDPGSLPDSISWERLGVQENVPFRVPRNVSSASGRTQVTIKAQGRADTDAVAFTMLQQGSFWGGNMPSDMRIVWNLGIASVRLEFDPPISAFATYLEVSGLG